MHDTIYSKKSVRFEIARTRSCPTSVPAWSQEEADGSHQEAPQGEEGGAPEREASSREDASPRHDHRPRDDWLRRWYLQRQGVSIFLPSCLWIAAAMGGC